MTEVISLRDYDGVALDFDGTLADTIGAHTAARIQAFEELGIHATTEQHELAHRSGNTPKTIIGNLLILTGQIPANADLNTHEFVTKTVEVKNEIYRIEALNGLDAQPGAVEFFNRVLDIFGKDRVSIVTTARTDEVQAFLHRFDLIGHLRPDLLISHDTAEDLGIAFKPAPDMYRLAADRMGISTARMLVVEDSPGGVDAGKLAGSPVLAMGTTNPEDILSDPSRIHRPDHFAVRFADIELAA